MADDVQPVVAPKPGYKTTEFWLSLAAMILGGVMASGAVCVTDANSAWCKIAGMAVAVLAQLGYTYSRTVVKS